MIPAHPSPPSTFAALMFLLVQPAFLVRPPLLTRIYAFSRARCSRRLPTPIDRSCSTLEDVRLSAGALVSQLFSKGSHLLLTALPPYSYLQPAVMPKRLTHKS